jgi:hypothetical protein
LQQKIGQYAFFAEILPNPYNLDFLDPQILSVPH